MNKLNFERSEIEHILTLIIDNERKGDYYGDKKEYWERSDLIKKKLLELVYNQEQE